MSHHKRDRYGSAEPITLPRPFPTRAPRSSLTPNVEIDELFENNTVVAVQGAIARSRHLIFPPVSGRQPMLCRIGVRCMAVICPKASILLGR